MDNKIEAPEALWTMLLVGMVTAGGAGLLVEKQLANQGIRIVSAAQSLALVGSLTGKMPDVTSSIPEDVQAIVERYGVKKMALCLAIALTREGLSEEGQRVFDSAQFKAYVRAELDQAAAEEAIRSWAAV